jgi:hypothetical protein
MNSLGLPFLRGVSEEARWKDGYRACAAEARASDAGGSSDGCC